MVFPGLRKIIDVRGCFWHSHSCRRNRPRVASRIKYWYPKLARNIQRDLQNMKRLRNLGWNVLVIWECELKNSHALVDRIEKFLSDSGIRRASRRTSTKDCRADRKKGASEAFRHLVELEHRSEADIVRTARLQPRPKGGKYRSGSSHISVKARDLIRKDVKDRRLP